MKQSRATPDTEELLRHVTWVRGLVQRLVRDPAWRADIEQETWLAALTGQPRGLRDARGWLARVARNAVRHRARSEARRAAREQDTARTEALPGVDVLSAQAELQRRVVQAVLELEERLREPLLLHYFHGLSAAEIARRKGCPASTVRDRLARGLARLRDVFEAEYPERGERARAFGLLLLPLRVEATSRVALTAAVALLLAFVGAAVLVGFSFLRSTPDAGVSAPLADTERAELVRTEGLVADVADEANTRATVLGDPSSAEAPAAAAPASDAGRVVEPDGRPVEGALVTVARVPAYSTDPVSIGVAARTDAEGVYRLPRALATRGDLCLVAEATGFAPELVDFEPEARIVLDPAAALRIRVTEAESGRAVAAARFTAGEFDWQGGRARPSVADADGRLVFDRARIDRPLYARVAAPGHAFQPVRIEVPGPGPHDVELTVTRGATLALGVFDGARPVADAELVFDFAPVGRTRADGTCELGGVVVQAGDEGRLEVRHPDYAPTLWRFGSGDLVEGAFVRLPVVRGCSVTGVVLDAARAPLADARVVLRRADPGAGPAGIELPQGVRLVSQFSGTLEARTDADGRFRIERVAPWTSWSSVAARDPLDRRWVRSDALRFDAPGERRDVELVFPRAATAISGRVLVAGEPVVARGTWTTATMDGELLSGADGRYRLVHLEGGELRIGLTTPGRNTVHEERVELPAEGELEHDILLSATGVRFAGRVVDASGEPASGISITAFDQGRPGSAVQGESDETGAFELYVDSEPGAPLTLLARHGPLMLSRFPIPAGTADYELVLPQLAAVVLVAEGETALAVSFRAEDEREFYELPTYTIRPAGAGRFRTQIPAGRVDLRVTRSTSGGPAVLLEGVEIDAAGGTEIVVPR